VIEVEVLATGSKGNCYILTSGESRILLDCGLPYKKTLKLLDFKLPTAVLVTHEHKDHAKAAEDFIKRGVDVFMTRGTADALNLEKSHRLNLIEDGDNFQIGDCVVFTFKVPHDAAEPVNFLVNDGEDETLYFTDLGYISKEFLLPTKILIETNYFEDELVDAQIDFTQKDRIIKNHLAVEQAEDFFRKNKFHKLKEIYLIHISERHGDGEKFQKIIREIVGGNIKVNVAKNKKLEE